MRNAGTTVQRNVGVDDSARDRSQAVTFEVYADRRLVARSPAMRSASLPSARGNVSARA